MTICIGDQIYNEQFSLKNQGKMNYPVLIGRHTLENQDSEQLIGLSPVVSLRHAAARPWARHVDRASDG